MRAPVEATYGALLDSLRWPEWWRGVARVEELEAGDERGLGNVRRYAFRSLLPYDLVFDMRATRVDAPTALEGEASGELVGTGRWLLRPDGDGTAVRYIWEVETTQRWMNALAPLMRPVFAWNHDIVMRRGERGLRRLLEAPR